MMSRRCLVLIAALCLLAGCASREEPAPDAGGSFELPPALRDPPSEIVFEQEQEPAALYRIYAGRYAEREPAEEAVRQLTERNLWPEIIESEGELLIFVTEVSQHKAAQAVQQMLSSWGYEAFVTRSRADEADIDLPDESEDGPAGRADAQAGSSAPFCDSRPALPEIRDEDIKEHIRLEEDTQARDPQLWLDEMTDPGCVLLTEDEAHALLTSSSVSRVQLNMQIARLEKRRQTGALTVYVGSFLEAADAEAAAALAAGAGIELRVQPGPGGSWIAAAPPAHTEEGARVTEQQLDACGLSTNARLALSAEGAAELEQLRRTLRQLDHDELMARLVLRQFAN